MKRSRVGAGVAVALAATMTAVLAACAGPQYTYVRDSDGQAYFKVPSDWRKVDQKKLDDKVFGDPASTEVQALKQVVWTVAYDADATPSADHLLPASGATKVPFALAMVRPLSQDERQQASLNYLRDALLPVTQMSSEAGNTAFKNFELLKDEELPLRDGVRGVRVVFNVALNGGQVQTFDKTAYLSADGGKLSALLIHCSPDCYKAQSKQIDGIAQSFRIKPDTP